MFIKRLLTFCLLFIGTGFAYCQDCNCSTAFQWLKKTFEENDAGFKYILSIKGQDAYDYHTLKIQEKINVAKTREECLPVLQEWLHFFRKGHIYIKMLEKEKGNESPTPARQLDTLSIKNQFKEWPRLQIALPEFEKYLDNKKTQDFEGIWDSQPYKIAIKKTENGYKGILINNVSPYWESGQVKLEIIKEGNELKGIAYMRDHSKAKSDHIEWMGQNYLQVAGLWLKRAAPVLPTETEVQDYLTSGNAKSPYIKQLDKNTLYFRVPSFDPAQKKAIDSVLNANDEMLSKMPNLIIDIRGNGGGSDLTFSNIIPYLKTNPISTFGVEYLSTSMNNKRMLDYINKPEYKAFFSNEQREWAKRSYDTLQMHLGEFVYLTEPIKGKEADDSVTKKAYPKQVGIIIDGYVASSAEQFVLAAKQSKKVKFFGTPTFGALDISNMYSIKDPCNEYELGYALSRSKRIPQYVLDDRGLQPDYFISNEIPEFKWVAYVKQILEQ
ncbi:MAG: S41 family peptidase [Chitinophagaceae bacterium]